MSAQAANDIRELTADELDLTAGAVNPWIVRIAVKIIIAGIDYVAENGIEGGSTPRHEREINGKI